ncbi:MAG TPA: sucrase ferredoxin [Pyrinomonadaceae bacterium]|nr:sucrase ferredoxin [Pyrinomonadaceae bacterium]
MSRDVFYCSEQSRRVGEKAYGTASIGDVWLLVEYPTAWGPKPLHDSTLPPPVKNHLSAILKNVPRSRLLFIKRERGCEGPVSCFLVRCRERDPSILKFELDDYQQLLEIDVGAIAAGQTLGGGVLTQEPLFLVCTHGRRDKCCAKFGRPVYKSLVAHEGHTVWQSSHVGGDRFAANLVCFPHGLFYAHVSDEGGKRIADEYRAGRLVPAEYRGRACFSYPVQAAEYFVRSESGIVALDELRQVGCERTARNVWSVRFVSASDGRIHQAKVTARMSEFQNLITCHAAEKQRVVQYVLDEYGATAGGGAQESVTDLRFKV